MRDHGSEIPVGAWEPDPEELRREAVLEDCLTLEEALAARFDPAAGGLTAELERLDWAPTA